MEPIVPLNESEIELMLEAFRRLESLGFRLRMPHFLREEGQSTAVFILVSEIQHSSDVLISSRVSLEKSHRGPLIKTTVTVSECTASAAGKSEIALSFEAAKKGEGALSSRVGHDASKLIKVLCHNLKIDRLAVIDRRRLVGEAGQAALAEIAKLQRAIVGAVLP